MALDDSAKILIVDDMVAMLVGLNRSLKQLGYTNIVEAENGEEAFAALAAHGDIALVISDWNMQPMDGLELLRAVRGDKRFVDLPFILASAEAGSLRRQADRERVTIIAKPFDIETLRSAVAAATS
jgi:two-component system chemotaxis response regulator CheY